VKPEGTAYECVGKIYVSNMVLGTLCSPFRVVSYLARSFAGYGSHGTIVYAGQLEGRSVAVKRMLVPFFELAHAEISLLMESDTHANVIRYFAKVAFLYLFCFMLLLSVFAGV
jgi:hypothetical protein